MSNSDMENNPQRIKLIAMLGSTSPRFSEIIQPLGRDLSIKCGGAFISLGQGFWSNRGNELIDLYPSDTIIEEPSLRIELLMVSDKAESMQEYLRERCHYYNHMLQLDCHYLHIEQLQATAHHVAIDY